MKKSAISIFAVGVGVLVTAGFVIVSLGKSKDSAQKHDMNNQPIAGIKTGEKIEVAAVVTDQVSVKDFAFSPKKITVKKGTKVIWTNRDSAHHDVTPDQESDGFKAGPLLGNGESYSFTFEKAGTYAYHCSPHPYMKATVEVTE